MLASHFANPRAGNIQSLINIFAYLDKKYNAQIVFNPAYPDIDTQLFKTCDWQGFYGNDKFVVTLNAPEPRGKDVYIRMCLDSDYASKRLC